AARQVAERARGDAAASRRRETELERAIADERGARAEAATRADELAERVRLLEAERERLLSGLVDRARVGGAPTTDGDAPEEGGADLAGFIAELRAEIEDLRAFKASVEQAGPGTAAASPRPASGPGAAAAGGPAARPEAHVARMPRADGAEPVLRLAARFGAAGRVGLTGRDADELKAVLPTRSDRVLYERAMDELGAADASRRVRAARTLEALGSRTAAPLLASALGRETDPDVKAAFLGALARFKEPFAADLARRELGDARAQVRVAALEALAAIAEGDALDALTGALGDASPLVRRRAVILLGFARGGAADAALAKALGDADAGVARAAAASLAGRPSAAAQNALARGLEHADAGVRRAAAGALGRFADAPVDPEAPAHERRRAARRIAERLAALSAGELREAVLAGAAAKPGPSSVSTPLTPTGGGASRLRSPSASGPPASPSSKSGAPPPTPPTRGEPLLAADARTTAPAKG
ncbi:MAG TPA: HEAT repeat domain-containing protein, partial [Anaeromyxobacteraceae bacterium]|nr:HEAT repeat domain-containing protein [Anaeromyxobacteraceae bacterium]